MQYTKIYSLFLWAFEVSASEVPERNKPCAQMYRSSIPTQLSFPLWPCTYYTQRHVTVLCDRSLIRWKKVMSTVIHGRCQKKWLRLPILSLFQSCDSLSCYVDVVSREVLRKLSFMWRGNEFYDIRSFCMMNC